MEELNENKPMEITIKDDYSFYINEDTTNNHKFEGNGEIFEYKIPLKKPYLSFKDNTDLPFIRTSIKENFQSKKKVNQIQISYIYLYFYL